MSYLSKLKYRGVLNIKGHENSSFFYYAYTPIFWLRCILYFVIATPFELDRSGFSYLIKLICVLFLLLPLLINRITKLTSYNNVIIIIILAFISANITEPNQRFVVGAALVLTTFTLGQVSNEKWLGELKYILGVYLSINTIGFVLQIIFLVGTGGLFDLHGTIFPAASRIEFMESYARLSGFHNEPGTYSQWMLMTLFFRSLISNRLLTPLNVLAALTIAASVSLWGVLGVGAFLMAAALEALFGPKGSAEAKKLGFIFLLFGAFAFVFSAIVPESVALVSLDFLENKAGLTTDSGLDKILAMEEIQKQFWSVFIIGNPMTPGFCPDCMAPNDVGVWATSIYYFGFVTTLIVFIMMTVSLIRFWGIKFLPLLVIMMFWKAPVYDPSLWILVGIILSGVNMTNQFPKSRRAYKLPINKNTYR